jgi:hypothetical protein
MTVCLGRGWKSRSLGRCCDRLAGGKEFVERRAILCQTVWTTWIL